MEYVVHCKKSKYDVYCGRPSKWGNPYSHKEGTIAKYKVNTREEAIKKFKEYLLTSGLINDILELKGKVLGCWCKPKACHCDLLAKLANEEDMFENMGVWGK